MLDLLAQLAVFLLLYLMLIRPISAALLFSRPPRLRVTFRTPADWDVPYEDIRLTSRDGTRLAGWYVPSRNGAAVILLHGHGGNRLAVAFHAEALVRQGYGVLLYDLRAHGDSGGRRFTFGESSIDDVLAAVAFVSRRADVEAGRIGIMGVSVGGLLAIQAAGRTGAIHAVAADGPAPATMADLPPAAGMVDRFWRYPLEAQYRRMVAWFAREPAPGPNRTAVAVLSPRPLLLIATGRGMEQRLAAELYAAAGEPRTLWTVPEAGHGAAWRVAPEAYAEEVVRFFADALAVGVAHDTIESE